jgi:hypothetical protein
MTDFDDGANAHAGPDTLTEVTSRSWFARIGSSLTGLLIGPVVVLGAIVLLFWNEGRAVGTTRSLTEGAGAVVSVAAGTIDPANEGRLVHVTGPVTTAEKLRDAATGVEADGLRIVRKVEAFQWRETSTSETRKKLGGGEETVTTHSYALGWTDHPADGSAFKQPEGHRNPPVALAGETVTQRAARIGAFALSPAQAGRFGTSRPLPVERLDRTALQKTLGIAAAGQLVDGRIYVGIDATRPRLGDLRISYELATTPDATVVARQTGTGFTAFTTSNGRSIEILRDGAVSPTQVFDDALSGNTTMTWIIRVGGILVLAFGFGLVLGPLSVLADIVPFVGDLIGGASSMVALAAAVLVGSVTIAVAWFASRPLLSAGLIVAGLVVAYGFRRLAGRRPAAVAT